MATEGNKEFKTFGEEFFAQYPRNKQGGFDSPPEDWAAMQRIGKFLKEVEEGEARMFQINATSQFIGLP